MYLSLKTMSGSDSNVRILPLYKNRKVNDIATEQQRNLQVKTYVGKKIISRRIGGKKKKKISHDEVECFDDGERDGDRDVPCGWIVVDGGGGIPRTTPLGLLPPPT